MADNTKIEWTDATVNAVNGCSVVSPGCTNCYAMRLAGTRMKDHPTRKGLTIDSKAGPVWNGEIRVNEKAMLEPLRWAKPRMCFWNAHGDLFHPAVPDEVIDRCFAVMALTPHHTHQVLTKRSTRMREYMSSERAMQVAIELMGALLDEDSELDPDETWALQQRLGRNLPPLRSRWPLPNVWLGVSVEDQQRADERIPDLLATPASVRWLSCEPLLGPVDLSRVAPGQTLQGREDHEHVIHALRGGVWDQLMRVRDASGPALNWIVVGGESGPGARPMHPDWARSLRDQCAAADVPFLFKQWGAWSPLLFTEPATDGNAAWPDGSVCFGRAADHGGAGEAMYIATKKIAGRLLDGVQHDGYPNQISPASQAVVGSPEAVTSPSASGEHSPGRGA